MTEPFDIRSINLHGDHLSLDFCNTIHDRFDAEHFDYLSDYGDLVEWGAYAGAITEAEGKRLHGLATKHPRAAVKEFRAATELRATLYRLLLSVVRHERIDSAELQALNRQLSVALRHLEIHPSDQRFVQRWNVEDDGLGRIRWGITKASADLLTSEQLDRVKQCPSCGWLFLDTSKNRSRRWCSMKSCGNRAKARRHYARSRGTES